MPYTVTQRASQVSQPRGGYVPLGMFSVEKLDDGIVLNESENLHSAVVGMAVEAVTRSLIEVDDWTTGNILVFRDDEEVFSTAFAGAQLLARATGDRSPIELCENLAASIRSSDDAAIVAACRLSSFEAVYRRGPIAFKPLGEIQPDAKTIENIRVMAERTLDFFEENGPVTMLGPEFWGGYSKLVLRGDGDILTHDAIWDIKTIKNQPKREHRLQLYMYYLMSQQADAREFSTVKSMGIFNPRLNTVYRLDPSTINESVEREVQTEVLGYVYDEERGEVVNSDRFTIDDCLV